MQKAAEEDGQKKPKRVFAFGGGGGAFAQIMRQQMNGTEDQGPRRLNTLDQQDYKDIGITQQSSMKEKVQAVNAKEQTKK